MGPGQDNDYHMPKDWGTTGIALRRKVVKEDITTWKEFFDVAPKYSGQIVVVDSTGDVFVAPLKALGYSLNSVDPTELDARPASCSWASPRTSWPSTRTTTRTAPTGEAVLGLTWTGGLDELKAEPETADTKYIIPTDGTLYWLDTWVILKDRAAPERRLRVPELHPGAGDPGAGDDHELLRHAERRGEEVRATRRSSTTRRCSSRRRSSTRASSRAPRTSRRTRSGSRSGRSSVSKHRRLIRPESDVR